jgi:rod shape determining protein RodA
MNFRSGWNDNAKHIDLILLITVLIIAVGGVLAIHSALHGQPSASGNVRKQAVGIVLGLAAMIALASSDYTQILRRHSRWLYWFNLFLLTIVLLHGHSSRGAQRWLSLGPIQVQPSEFCKIILIIALALFITQRKDDIREWRMVLSSILYISVPLLLIFKQPDLGTALVVGTLWFGMMFVGGAKWQHLAILFVGATLMFAGLWHFHVLKDYQKKRLIVFLNPNADPRDTGYHLHQSQIAIGSGEVTGQGYQRGMQANGHFIPEQHTDFIFTIVGEEGGFIGAIFLLALYLLVLERSLVLLIVTEDYLGRLLIAGVVSMLAFHIIVNIGMTIGVMPVTGVPLPFFSYGLSALLVDMASVGLVLSVAARKHRTLFGT